MTATLIIIFFVAVGAMAMRKHSKR